MKRSLLLLALALHLAVTAVAHAEADTPQSLYLKAGKEERQGETARARQTYESIIDRFPESEFAVKANDRLLAIIPMPPAAAAAPTAAAPAVQPSASASETAIPPLPFLAPEQPAPLPADPIKSRGVELARRYQKALNTYKGEYERQEFAFKTTHGHRYNRTELSQQQKEWEAKSQEKVQRVFGAPLEAIRQQLQQACDEAGISGSCNEQAFRQ